MGNIKEAFEELWNKTEMNVVYEIRHINQSGSWKDPKLQIFVKKRK